MPKLLVLVHARIRRQLMNKGKSDKSCGPVEVQEPLSGYPALLAVVQTTNFWYRDNRTQFDRFYSSRFWAVFLQG